MILEKNLKETDNLISQSDLCAIAERYGTDKSYHGYTKVYHELMKVYRELPVSIFEIGIYLGNSIKMWRDYFTNGKVYGIDNGRLVPNTGIRTGDSNEVPSEHDNLFMEGKTLRGYDFKWLEDERTKCAIADQRSIDELNNVFNYFNCSEFDFIIDDGHHYQEHQQKTLGLLFKNVKPGGYYLIEDVAHIDDLISGQFWGQKNKDGSDSTYNFYYNYLFTNKFNSEWMTNDELNYLQENVQDVYMFDGGRPIPNSSEVENSNYNLRCNSRVIVIKKKNMNF